MNYNRCLKMCSFMLFSVLCEQTAVKTLGGLDMLILNHGFAFPPTQWTGTKQNLDQHDKSVNIYLLQDNH